MSTCKQFAYYTRQNFWILTRQADFITNRNTKDKYQKLVSHAAKAYDIKPVSLEEGANSDADCSYDYVNIQYPSQPSFAPRPFYYEFIDFVADYIFD